MGWVYGRWVEGGGWVSVGGLSCKVGRINDLVKYTFFFLLGHLSVSATHAGMKVLTAL